MSLGVEQEPTRASNRTNANEGRDGKWNFFLMIGLMSGKEKTKRKVS